MLVSTWQAMSRLHQPRNAKNVGATYAEGERLVVSFVGDTGLPGPHVFCDSGRRYDFRFAANRRAEIVVKPGIDAGRVMEDLYIVTEPYPTLIDLEAQILASIVPKARGGLQLWPRARGSEPWRALFG